jgi:NADP-dependent 3-hydroxy acid dehydrogenase YdfG
MTDQRAVLITGASSGVGQSTAWVLSQRGYQVFGTSRNPAVADQIPGVEMLPLDTVRNGKIMEINILADPARLRQLDLTELKD